MSTDACTEEMETLSAIFLNEIEINDETPEGEIQISMILYPATADDEESRYVTLTLELILPQSYPKCPPKILFRNPRGLNDSMLDDLMKTMKARCEDRLESQMIYELVDMCKEFLTKNNRPASECPICLFSFTEFDVFYRTRCFHHFHSQCLGSYLKNLAATFKETDNVLKEKQDLTCPVCRECLQDDINIEKLIESPPPSEELESSSLSRTAAETTNPTKAVPTATNVLQDWEGRKKVLKQLYEKQKSQGGIIDLTEQKKMLVISSPGGPEDESQSPGVGGGTSNNGTNSAAGNYSTQQQQQSQEDQRNGRGQKLKSRVPTSSTVTTTVQNHGHKDRAQPCCEHLTTSGGSRKPPTANKQSDCQTGRRSGRDPDDDEFQESRHQNSRNRRYNNRRRNK
ncbi:E3 ubiquitin-protein ligase RNF25 [Folsomia candida]|uniref:Eukaryotic translation initiation factor 2-alpha kinase 4 n=1 Tax=Folsomia candida TaxID=158441 RepID=A0A226EZZ5_FOLCA|nr:E3 ubiquitin-protein ligase RNF25 [Folsomia candida]OXA63133.1 Eukaryotic translation initiation factor 2-alpha kinase 4 [Folsomia candida]